MDRRFEWLTRLANRLFTLIFNPSFAVPFNRIGIFAPLCTCLLFVSSTTGVCQETILQNNFDSYNEGAYTETHLNADWNSPEWEDGVSEGRVELVGGPEAFGGEGCSLAVHFPAGMHGTKDTGAQWKSDFANGHDEVFLSYRVKFGEGFDFVRGGKLPGLSGGSAPTGSAPADGINGWTGRMMWRTDFEGTSGEPVQDTSHMISYAKYVDSGFDADGRQEDKIYLIDSEGQRLVVESGVWYSITQRVVMNTADQFDGVLQIWIDDQLVHDQTDVRFRRNGELQCDLLFFSTFFGGNADWATSKDEVIYFDDFLVTTPAEPAPEPRFLKVPEHFPTIQDALDEARAGDTVAVRGIHRGNFVIDKPITFRGYTGTRIVVVDTSRPALEVACDNVLVKRIEFRGFGPGVVVRSNWDDVVLEYLDVRGFQFGIQVEPGCDNLVLNRNDVVRVKGDGITITDCPGVQLLRNRSYYNDGVGFRLSSCDGLYSTRSRAQYNIGNGFEVFSDNVDFQQNRADRNEGTGFVVSGAGNIFEGNHAWINGGSGFSFAASDNGLLVANISRFNSMNGMEVLNSRDNSLVDNISNDNDANGFLFDLGADRNIIDDNFMKLNGLSGLVLGAGTADNIVTNNFSRSNQQWGLVDDGTDNQFIDNDCRANGLGCSPGSE